MEEVPQSRSPVRIDMHPMDQFRQPDDSAITAHFAVRRCKLVCRDELFLHRRPIRVLMLGPTLRNPRTPRKRGICRAKHKTIQPGQRLTPIASGERVAYLARLL